MTNLAHLASSYLLVRLVQYFGFSLTPTEITAVLVAGNVIDLDSVVDIFQKKFADHHTFITHTPFGAILIWFAYLKFFFMAFSPFCHLLVLAALFLHLALDDSVWWFYQIKWQRSIAYPQINWFFPFNRQYRKGRFNQTSWRGVKQDYLNAKVNIVLEFVFAFAATYLLRFSSGR